MQDTVLPQDVLQCFNSVKFLDGIHNSDYSIIQDIQFLIYPGKEFCCIQNITFYLKIFKICIKLKFYKESIIKIIQLNLDLGQLPEWC